YWLFVLGVADRQRGAAGREQVPESHGAARRHFLVAGNRRFSLACLHHGAAGRALQDAPGRETWLAGRLDWRPGECAFIYRRQVLDRPLPDSHQHGLGIWRGGLLGDSLVVGLLLVADRAFRGRTDAPVPSTVWPTNRAQRQCDTGWQRYPSRLLRSTLRS